MRQAFYIKNIISSFNSPLSKVRWDYVKKTLISVFLVGLLGVVSALMLNYIDRTKTPTNITTEPISININKDMSLAKTFDIYLKVVVIRDGHIIDTRMDYKDPILRNFYVLMYNYFLGGRAAGKPMNYVDDNGYAHYYMDTESGTVNPQYIGIAIGNGTAPVIPTNAKLYEVYKSTTSVDEEPGENSTHMWINYTATFYIDTAINISEAGLFIDSLDSYIYGSESPVRVYITRDLIDPPVELQADDYLIITYTIYAKKSGNFVENFFTLIHNYLLRNQTYQMADYNDTSGVQHFYVDTESGGYNPVAYIQLGNNTTGFDFYRYNLTSPIAIEKANVRYEDHTPDNITVCISALFTFTEDYNISEIGVVLRLDSDSSSNIAYTDVLILYIPLTTPIGVTAGQQLSFKVTITLSF